MQLIRKWKVLLRSFHCLTTITTFITIKFYIKKLLLNKLTHYQIVIVVVCFIRL